MDDGTSRPGWWLASDGNWYPPGEHADPTHRERWAAADADGPPDPPDEPDLEATAIITPPAAPPPSTADTAAAPPPPPPPPARPRGATAGSPPAPTPAPGPKRRRPLVWAAAVLVFAAVVVGAVVVFESRTSTPVADAATTQLEPVGFAGADPFATNMSVHEVSAFPDDVKPVGSQVGTGTGAPGSGVVQTGTTPGLYGGTNDNKACDAHQLESFLHDNPDKAKAWAEVEGLSSPAEIDQFVDGLTPVVLTTDTRVTNHGFKNGKAFAIDAVLQRGTAVLVDSTGVPRTKCACGNPLLKPPTAAAPTATTGTTWAGYAAGNVIVVQPGAVVVTLQIVNIDTGQLMPVPVGSASGGVVVALGEPGLGPDGGKTPFRVNAKGFDPSAWETPFTAPTRIDGLGFGNGTFVAVGSASATAGAGSVVYTGDPTGHTWTQVGTVPDARLRDVAFGNGRWLAVGTGSSPTKPTGGLVYQSTDAKTWTKVAEVGGSGLDGNTFSSIAFGSGRWEATLQSGHEPIVGMYTSTDGTNWTRTDLQGSSAVVGYGEGAGWLAGGRDESKNASIAPGDVFPPAQTWRSANGTSWTQATANAYVPFIGGLSYIGGAWYATAWDQQGIGLHGIVTSADGLTWSSVPLPPEQSFSSALNDLAYSGGPLPSAPAAPGPGTAPATTPGASGGATTIAATSTGHILRNTGGPAGPSWVSAYQASGPVSGVAFGNGMFAAIGGKSCTNVQGVCTASTVLRSDATGQTWTEAGTVPEPLADLAYGNGTWTAVGTASGPAGQTPLEYQSTDLTTWKKVTPTVTDRGSGTADGGFVTIAFADGHWAGTIFYGETALGAHSQLVTSTDGVHWDSPALANSQDTAAWARGFAGVAHGDKGWLAIGQNSDWDGNGPISAAKQTGVVISSSDGTSWSSSATTPADVSAIAPVFSGGSWYAISAPLTSAPTTSVDLLSSADGKAWTRAGTITIPAGAKSGSTVGPAVTDLAAAA